MKTASQPSSPAFWRRNWSMKSRPRRLRFGSCSTSSNATSAKGTEGGALAKSWTDSAGRGVSGRGGGFRGVAYTNVPQPRAHKVQAAPIPAVPPWTGGSATRRPHHVTRSVVSGPHLGPCSVWIGAGAVACQQRVSARGFCRYRSRLLRLLRFPMTCSLVRVESQTVNCLQHQRGARASPAPRLSSPAKLA
jgi:hypothetical protein